MSQILFTLCGGVHTDRYCHFSEIYGHFYLSLTFNDFNLKYRNTVF